MACFSRLRVTFHLLFHSRLHVKNQVVITVVVFQVTAAPRRRACRLSFKFKFMRFTTCKLVCSSLLFEDGLYGTEEDHNIQTERGRLPKDRF